MPLPWHPPELESVPLFNQVPLLHPLEFHPCFMERPWGGDGMLTRYHKAIPGKKHIGESWEICDRADVVSTIRGGPFVGRDLRWVMDNHFAALMGNMPGHCAPGDPVPRFPWLIKILDCTSDLSLQVHPPPELAAAYGAEPKTEMWYFTHAEPGAAVWAGLKPGVTREDLQKDVGQPGFAKHLHRIPVQSGDALFLPSGRVHAPGAGVMIFEVQENSDTTYRLYDWGRKAADGSMRELHIEKGLACIAMDDVEPTMAANSWSETSQHRKRQLASCGSFKVSQIQFNQHSEADLRYPGLLQVLGVSSGSLRIISGSLEFQINPGEFILLPASCNPITIFAAAGTDVLSVRPPEGVAPVVTI